MTGIRNLRIEWIEAFVAVVDCTNRTAAGQQIGRDQATVTKFVQKLEVWFKEPLIETGSVPVRLTPAGSRFVDSAREILDILNKARPVRLPATSARVPRISGANIKVD